MIRFNFVSIFFYLPSFSQTIYSQKVIRAIDGNAIELENGERMRYIGIDTPEIAHPTQPVGYHGKEASETNKKLVEGKSVRLEFNEQERDQYGRLLAYVFVSAEQ